MLLKTEADLKPYQVEGVNWLVTPTLKSGEGHKLLADEPALGKTVQVAVALKRLNATSLVVCPKNVKKKNGWGDRLIEWGTYKANDIQVIETSKDVIDWKKRCIIVNPELALRDSIRSQLQFTKFDTLVVDEGHVAKSVSSKIAQKLLSVRHGKPLVACASRTWVVTGTPSPNGRPLELFPWLVVLARECLGRYTTQQLFGDRYCGGEAMSYTGSTNRDELNLALQPFMLCRRLRDVEPDLPPITWENVFIDVGDMLEDESNTEKATLRRLVAERSAPFVAQFINELIAETDERVVCFTHHRSVGQVLIDQCKGQPFWGGQSELERSRILQWYESEGRLLVVQYTAGGTALDGLQHLTRTVVLGEPNYIPDLQAIRRIERIGQCNPIRIYRMIAEKPLHSKMINLQKSKTHNISEIIKTMAKAKVKTTPSLDTLAQFFSDVTRMADALETLANDGVDIPVNGSGAVAAATQTPAPTPTAAPAPAAGTTAIPDVTAPVASTLTVEDVRTAAKEALTRFPTQAAGESAVNAYFVAAFGKQKTSELDPATYQQAIDGLKTLSPAAPPTTVSNDI